MKQLNNILGVALSNIVGFGTSFIVGFILPAILTVADYGKYREFILFTSFAYVINMGFNDGIYIKYGGKEKHEVKKETVNNEHIFINLFQFIILIIMVGGGFLLKNPNFILFSIASFFITLTTYHQNFYQATGQFNLYSKTYVLRNAFYIISLLGAIFVIKSKSYLVYSIIYILSYFFLYIIYEYLFFKENGISRITSISGNFPIFKIGFFILIANMSLTFVGNIGNWVVNAYYGIESFAQYSFQNSLLNVILLVINAVGMVFYNVLSKKYDEHLIIKIKNISLYLGILSGLAFFPLKLFIITVLPQYIPASSLLSITFIAIPYLITSKILIANLYKVDRNEKKYFNDSLIYAIASFVFVFVVNLYWKDIHGVAFTTTLCYVLWYIYCTRIEFKFLIDDWKQIAILFLHSVVMFLSANFMGIISGFIVYCLYLFTVFLFNKSSLLKLIKSF